jgi:natural product precursor
MKALKLTALEADVLSRKAMNGLKGGIDYCGCSCYYAHTGGSSSDDNGNANYNGGGLISKKGDNKMYVVVEG